MVMVGSLLFHIASSSLKCYTLLLLLLLLLLLHFIKTQLQTGKMKSPVSLWWIWLYGSFLITLSLYATRKLPSVQQVINRKPSSSSSPNITIFSAITHHPIGQRQRLAVRSWLALSNQITVVLFSQHHHPSVSDFASGFEKSRVLVDSAVDFTFLGTPFFHSMVERSQAFATDIVVFAHSQAVLLPDFVPTLNFAHELDGYWLLVASLPETEIHGERLELGELQEMINGRNRSNSCKDTSMIMAWNSGSIPLHNGVLPPFLFGKGIHNHWLVNEAIASELRVVFDASSTISGLFLNEPDMLDNRSWEAVGNSHLGSSYGSLLFHEANYSTSLPKLAKHGDRYVFTKGMFGCSELRNLQPLEFQASLESLLEITADEMRTVVLAVAGYSYKDMLMSWVCRLRRLKVTNFVICALDHETFGFSVLQGLPVFYDPSAPRNISFDDCHFGTKCFQRVTKVKSRLVLKILKLGYNVLLSDVDVYWFRNPLQFLGSFGPGFLVAQSDEYNKTGKFKYPAVLSKSRPINFPRRLNSGFYFARSDAATIAAMDKVVIHAASSGLSEQPSFYDVMCGEGGSNRISDNRCLEPETNLTVHFLDRDLFPNGAYLDLWDEPNVTAACMKKGCFVLHNNWINGRLKKLERQVSSGLWEYDSSKRMCLSCITPKTVTVQ
ncbi:Beta-arabinofuranosyltransferase RAY1 [Linum grandiflorum]